MGNQLITHRLLIDYSLIARMSLMSSISYVWIVISIAHFTVTSENETGDDLVLIQPGRKKLASYALDTTLPALLCKSCLSYAN